MGVVDRLKRLTGENQAKPDDKQALLGDLRRRIETIMSRRDRPVPTPLRLPPVPLSEVVAGEEITNAHGVFFCAFTRHAGSSRHGHTLIRDCASLDMPAASLLANQPRLAECLGRDALFLDTETTGLAGGTGTFPFLIGLGWFEDEGFVTAQLFARDYSEERPMLAFLQETAAEKRFLITFNGRAFDINLLAARFVLNRLADPFPSMPHLDLLNPARKILAHRTSNCRLVTLEDEVLGFSREGDVPGWEIPQRYFDWLRFRNAHLLGDVFEHNRYDIISMAALARHLSDVLSGRPTDPHPGDLLAAARLLHERGRIEAAQALLETIITTPTAPAAEARRLLSLVHKRRGHWHLAVGMWAELLAQDAADAFAAEELAKFCEHRTHDYARAIALVRQALACPGISPRVQADLAHRLERLLVKEAARMGCHTKHELRPE